MTLAYNPNKDKPKAQTQAWSSKEQDSTYQDKLDFRSTDSPLLRKHGFGLRQRIGKGDLDIEGIKKKSMERLLQQSQQTMTRTKFASVDGGIDRRGLIEAKQDEAVTPIQIIQSNS